MTEPEEHCLPDLDSLSSEEKDMLIGALHEQLHASLQSNQSAAQNAITLAGAMDTLKGQLQAGDMLGHRASTMRLVAFQLASLAAVTYSSLGLSRQEVSDMDTFTDIVSQLEDEPGLQFPPKGQDD